MRVAILSPYDPRPPEDGADPHALRGGVEEALDRTASGLAARGHDVTLVCSAPRASERTDPDGVRVVRVKRRAVVFRNPIAPLRGAVPRDAEVVHVPATYAFVSDLVPLLERRPTVLDYHFDVHGTSAAMRAAAWTHRHTLGRGMTRATRIVAKSLDYARHSRVLRGLPPERLDWVPNGVDVEEFDADAARGDDVVCVGRLVPYKGVDVLVRAAPRIHRETGARVVVVGDGPERARLEALAKGLPVELTGRLPRAEVRRRLATARVAVLPSVNSQEAFGIALLEAMASGAPVVASDLPGVREVAALGGLLAPPGDADALAARVIEAWSKPSAFGSPRALRARVAATYGWPAVLDRWEAVYRRALA
ncbi:MAG TPA: glycosyltransferase family 4 protein [Candidatus Thermoplasmatota archaeon]|nr:glycosyltransferase family 4 protein [Candidatus Thermoplasmatota archaeon]